jgi:hypothetical protein
LETKLLVGRLLLLNLRVEAVELELPLRQYHV